jgi:hypothetical protein
MAAALVPPTLSKKLEFDPKILGSGSSGSIEIGVATAADVLLALAGGPFPDREIELGSVEAKVASGDGLKFSAGALDGTAQVSAGVEFGLTVTSDGSKALEQLALEDTGTLSLTLPDTPGVRYLVLRAGYSIAGTASAKHPIGVLGSATFGIEAAHSRLLSVVSRFKKDADAMQALSACVKSFRLPRQVSTHKDLAPGAMLISEADGSIAFQVAATLGYDFSFVREAKALGLTGDIGLEIEAGLTAAFGFEASGRYLIVIDRASLAASSTLVKLDLFKLNKKGWNFGLSLSAKAQGSVGIVPEEVDDLLAAVFGVHGAQVIKDLRAIEDKWLNKEVDLSDTIAGLATSTGLDLLQETTGIEPKAQFDKAKARLMAALKLWDELPERVSARLWSLIGKGVTKAQLKVVEDTVKTLASGSEDERQQVVASLIEKAGLDDSLLSQLIEAAAEKGLLSLVDRTDEVLDVAEKALAILKGDEIAKLHAFIEERLKLDSIRKIATKADFAKLDAWLVNRLSQFLDDKLNFEKLDQIKNAIGAVLAKRQEIYAKARQALERQYDFSFAYAYRKDTERTALLSATFDMAAPAAAALFNTVVTGDIDPLMASPTPGVTLHKGVLTHSISRRSSVEVAFPFYSSRTEKLNTSLAKVTATDDSGRVLLYELDATDERLVRNRLKSQLAVGAAIPLQTSGNVRVHSVQSASWSYQFRSARENIRRTELEQQLAPFVETYLADHFKAGGESSFSTWLADVDRQVEAVVGRPTDDFGDLLLALEVTLPARVLGAWLQPRSATETRRAAMNMSRALQASLRQLLPFYYFQNIKNLDGLPGCAAMMLWSALPVSTDVKPAGETLEINADLTDPREDDVYWDWLDLGIRKRMVEFRETGPRLALAMASAERRLREAGDSNRAGTFTPTEGNRRALVAASLWRESNRPFESLLRLESVVTQGAANALREMEAFHANAETLPSKAIERLADFGAAVTSTFHDRISSIYGDDSLRSLGSMIFVEASRALIAGTLDAKPNALLSLTVLKDERTFSLPDFLKGLSPAPGDIAVAERLVAF